MREPEEWFGKTPNTKIPDYVKTRIWVREEGRCHISGAKIRPGDAYEFEHVIALCNGGEHREGNIALALKGPHKEKTARDRKEKAKVDSLIKKHSGIKQPSKAWGRFTKRYNKLTQRWETYDREKRAFVSKGSG